MCTWTSGAGCSLSYESNSFLSTRGNARSELGSFLSACLMVNLLSYFPSDLATIYVRLCLLSLGGRGRLTAAQGLYNLRTVTSHVKSHFHFCRKLLRACLLLISKSYSSLPLLQTHLTLNLYIYWLIDLSIYLSIYWLMFSQSVYGLLCCF